MSNERDMGPLLPAAKALMVKPLLGRDAREWEQFIEEVYFHGSNYKSFGGSIPLDAPHQTTTATDGRLLCPSGAGFGMTLDPQWLGAARVV